MRVIIYPLGCKFGENSFAWIDRNLVSCILWIPVFRASRTFHKYLEIWPKTAQTGRRVLFNRPISTAANRLEQVSIDSIPRFIDVTLKRPWMWQCRKHRNCIGMISEFWWILVNYSGVPLQWMNLRNRNGIWNLQPSLSSVIISNDQHCKKSSPMWIQKHLIVDRMVAKFFAGAIKHNLHVSWCEGNEQCKIWMTGSIPGIEPGTSCTRSRNHTSRPNGRR